MSDSIVIPVDTFAALRDLLSVIGNEKRAMRILNRS